MTESAEQRTRRLYAAASALDEEHESNGALIVSAMRDAQALLRTYAELMRAELGAQLAVAARTAGRTLTALTLLLVSLPFVLWSLGTGVAVGLRLPTWIGVLGVALLPLVWSIVLLSRRKRR